MKLKEITDAEKAWFDYVAYLLRIAAWFLAVAYAAHQILRPRPPGMEPPTFEWIGVFMAGAFGLFLLYRFGYMSLRMKDAILEEYKSDERKFKILRAVLFFWMLFGLPTFTIAVTGEIIELYLEKYISKPNTDAPK